MDTHDARKRSLAEQAELLKSLGFDGAGHLWLDQVAERVQTLDRVGLKLFQVYLRLDIAPAATSPFDARLKDVLPWLKGRGTMLAVLIGGGKPSDQSGDARAVELLRDLADQARPYEVQLALYPHVGDWLETVEDAVRLAKKTQRPNLGVMFNLCHWLKTSPQNNVEATLRQARPFLMAVSINGSDSWERLRAGSASWILPLDRGDYSLIEFLQALDAVDYHGPVGLQCYGIAGDARDHLARSIAEWRRLNRLMNRKM